MHLLVFFSFLCLFVFVLFFREGGLHRQRDRDCSGGDPQRWERPVQRLEGADRFISAPPPVAAHFSFFADTRQCGALLCPTHNESVRQTSLLTSSPTPTPPHRCLKSDSFSPPQMPHWDLCKPPFHLRVSETEGIGPLEGMTSVEEQGATNVALIGIVGCSASGKTTVANRLAVLLRSPLRPISMDAFFDANACEVLGTWEDPRCIRSVEYAQFISEIRSRLRRTDGTCVSVATSLQGMSGAAEFLRCTPHETLPSTTSDDLLSDVSLVAHAEEDSRLQRQSIEVHTMTDSGTHFVGDRTLYVVCEGFLLFADAAVSKLFDCFVFIHIDEETACLRRFFRTPRRHSHHNPRLRGCTRRIERMMKNRRNPSLRSVDGACGMSSSSLLLQAFSNLHFVPPIPSVPGNYEQFWLQQEFRRHPPPPPPPPESTTSSSTSGCDSGEVESSFSWMEVKDLSYIKQVLDSRLTIEDEGLCSSTTDTTTAAQEADDVTILQRYFEFRYWFFYEVLYYYRQFYPLMMEHVAMASRGGVAKDDSASSCVYRINEGAGVSEAVVDLHILSLTHFLVTRCAATTTTTSAVAATTATSGSDGGM